MIDSIVKDQINISIYSKVGNGKSIFMNAISSKMRNMGYFVIAIPDASANNFVNTDQAQTNFNTCIQNLSNHLKDKVSLYVMFDTNYQLIKDALNNYGFILHIQGSFSKSILAQAYQEILSVILKDYDLNIILDKSITVFLDNISTYPLKDINYQYTEKAIVQKYSNGIKSHIDLI